MDITVERNGAAATLIPTGDLHREESNQITQLFDQILASDATAIIVSFREVTALLSEGIRCLVTLRDKAAEAGKDFYITELPFEVRYTLKITNLLEFLNYVETPDQIKVKPAGEKTRFGSTPAVAAEKTRPAPAATPSATAPAAKPAAPVAPTTQAAKPAPAKPAASAKPAVPQAQPVKAAPAQPARKESAAQETPDAKSAPAPQTAKAPSPAPSEEKRRRRPTGFQLFGGSRSKAAEPEPAAEKTPEDPDTVQLSERDVQRLISRHIPGRMAVEIVEFFIMRKINVSEAASIAEAIGAKEKVVYKICKEMVARGVLKELGAGTFNYGPSLELDGQIRGFLKEWHMPNKQPRLLAMLLAVER